MKFFLIFIFTLIQLTVCLEKLFVCYYTNWAQYRPTVGKFMPEQIDPSLCTHIIYAFAKVVDDKLIPYEWNDEDNQNSKGLYTRTIENKKRNPKLKVLIGVGGWNHGPEAFSIMVHDEEKRKSFVRNCVEFLKKNRFDGLDLDWEYPGSRNGSKPTDRELFTLLAKEIKSAFKPYNYILTAAVAAGHETIDSGYEIEKLAEYFDFISLMAYDLHGAWEDKIDHNSPLYSRKSEYGDNAYLNVDWAVNYWLQSGFPKEKFVLGLATYGRPFKLKDPSKYEPGDLNDGAGTPGIFTREKGFLSYYEICEKLKTLGWKKKWSDEQKVPYAYGDNEWVGFEDVESLKIKARYILEKDLAGAMFWSLSLDDFSGNFCNEGKYPLINAVRNEILFSYKPLRKKNNQNSKKENKKKPNINSINNPILKLPEYNEQKDNKLPTNNQNNRRNPNNSNFNFPKNPLNNNNFQKVPYMQENNKLNQYLNNKNWGNYGIKKLNFNQNELKEKLFVCYYTNWAQYRPTVGKFMPEQIDPSLCTHIIYAFAKVVDDKLIPYEWNDEDTQWSKGLYSKIMDLKKKNPKLKVLIGVGGWNHGPEAFSIMVHDEAKRKSFVRNCVEFLKKNRFDGLDLDWEYPGSRNGSKPTDKELFTVLIKELKDSFRPFNYLLTAAVAAGHDNIVKAYEIQNIKEDLDFICLMAYDLHGAWEDKIDHNSPLYSRKSEYGDNAYLNVDWAVNYWLQSGFPKEKFVLGLATYGRPFKLKDPSKYEPGDLNDGAGTPGIFTREKGFLSYYEICTKILSEDWTKKWSDEQKVPYAYGDNEWVGFEDVESLKIKARYILEKDLAGAMFWSLSLDDFSGNFCNEGKYPLINAVRNEIINNYKPIYQDEENDMESDLIENAQFNNQYNYNLQEQNKKKESNQNNYNKEYQIQVHKIDNDQKNKALLENNLKIDSNLNNENSNLPSNNFKDKYEFNQLIPSDNLVKQKEKLFVCYYTNWAQYRPTVGKFMPEQINASLCTHIIYAFAKVVDDKLIPYEWNDEDTQWSKGLYSKIMDLKKKNPKLKVLIGVGGWNHGPEAFSIMVHDEAKRKSFVRNCVEFLKKNRFDGLDLDWEYPGSRNGSKPTDRELFTVLVKELKSSFKQHYYLLTAAVAAGHENILKAYEIDKIADYLDFICLMSYDLHGAWEDKIDHNSPLYSRKSEYGDNAYLNVDWAVNYWLQSGFPKEKFVLGLATYGRPFKLKDPSKYEPGDLNDGAGTPGIFTREKGFLSYYEICTKILSEDWTKKWSDEQKVPYAYGDNEWVGFEDVESLKIKARYILEKDLAGAMFWSLSLDDFSGNFCNEGKYPLINAVRNEILNGLKEPNFLKMSKIETTLISTTTEKQKTSPPLNNYGYFICVADGLFADVTNNCRAFFQCFRSNTPYVVKARKICPEGTLFNQDKQVCDWPNKVICG